MSQLELLGFDDFFASQLEGVGNLLVPCRVMNVQKSLYHLEYTDGKALAELSGGFRYRALDASDYPAVGDWVLCRHLDQGGVGIIERVLDRKTKLSRKGAGKTNDSQVVAANMDFVFIVQSSNKDFSPARMDRYIHAVVEGGAKPVVILSKSDLDPEGMIHYEGERVHRVSVLDPGTLNCLTPYLKEGQTIALVGSSGVGKSSLVNALSAEQVRVDGIRVDDDKGRHTTTWREIIQSREGGFIIDTPGMREFGIESSMDDGAVLDEMFQDIQDLERQCKYRNCTHQGEVGCAIAKAIESEVLDAGRLRSYEKLKKEERFHRERSITKDKLNSKRRFKDISKLSRRMQKER